jgi:hypothetical protein
MVVEGRRYGMGKIGAKWRTCLPFKKREFPLGSG